MESFIPKITEVNLYVFLYRLFHEDFSQARMLYAFEIYFAKKYTGSKMTHVVPICVHFYPC